jgi:hypothetical protein
MFSEIKRVLKRNGVCYLSTPHMSIFCTLLDPAYWIVGHRHYTQCAIIQFITQQKLYLSDIRLAGGWWEIGNLLNLYISKWLFKRPIFLKNYFENKLDHEYYNNNGFTNIYTKFRKV